jgi:hypothetical protein
MFREPYFMAAGSAGKAAIRKCKNTVTSTRQDNPAKITKNHLRNKKNAMF